jgi:cysteine desulfurase family protein (TIGR01976 family)
MAARFDLVYVRKQFPALCREVNGRPAAFLDSPGGTQTPQCVLDAITKYLIESNANIHGQFVTSEASDRMLEEAHAAVADLLGCSADEVVFGANMTTLNLLLAQAIMRDLRPGDEIVITELDHEANRGPWLHLVERGVVVREAPVDPSSCTLDYDALEALINERTKVVAIGHASNAVGTVNDVARVVRAAKKVGALTVVDAVHMALHGAIDVRALDCDFLLCSIYKIFGPHVGVMYGRRSALERLRPLKLVTQDDGLPFRFETGTLNHEGMAGTVAAVDFIADLGRRHGGADEAPGGATGGSRHDTRRRQIVAGMHAADAHEQPLAARLIEGLSELRGVTVYGPPAGHPRTSTVSFTLDRFTAPEVSRTLGERGLFVWDGHFYARRLVDKLGLLERGGLVRVGLAPYNTAEEVERVITAVGEIARAIH